MPFHPSLSCKVIVIIILIITAQIELYPINGLSNVDDVNAVNKIKLNEIRRYFKQSMDTGLSKQKKKIKDKRFT